MASPLEERRVVRLLDWRGALGADIYHDLREAPPLAPLPDGLLEGAEREAGGRCWRCLHSVGKVSAAEKVLAFARRSIGGEGGQG
jgi:hypothetical protein